MGKEEIRTFLTYLAVEKNVAPSTQNQALQALLFLYRMLRNRQVGVTTAARASIYFYNTLAEIDCLAEGIEQAAAFMGGKGA